MGETKKYADDKLDNYDPQNIRTLQKLTDEMLSEQKNDFERLLECLTWSGSSIDYERLGNRVKMFGAKA